jgi:hypothetical protein
MVLKWSEPQVSGGGLLVILKNKLEVRPLSLEVIGVCVAAQLRSVGEVRALLFGRHDGGREKAWAINDERSGWSWSFSRAKHTVADVATVLIG